MQVLLLHLWKSCVEWGLASALPNSAYLQSLGENDPPADWEGDLLSIIPVSSVKSCPKEFSSQRDGRGLLEETVRVSDFSVSMNEDSRESKCPQFLRFSSLPSFLLQEPE